MRSYGYAVLFIIAFLLLAHLVVGEAYLWYRNSISQLAGQGYEYAWIMRLGFIGFGLLVGAAGIGRIRADRRHWYRDAPIMLYGLAILLSGIFSTTPFREGAAYSEQEARMHSFFATSAGIALSVAVLIYALTDSPASRRVVHFIALVSIAGISMLFNALPEVAGAMQRLLWVAGFAWLAYLGSSPSGKESGEDPGMEMSV